MSPSRKVALIIIGIITFLLTIVGASYAFFSSTINTANANILYNVSFNNEYDFSVTLNNTANTGNTISISAEDMYFSGETEVIASYDNVFDITLVNNSSSGISCTYDYVWVWTTASGYNNYTKSSGATKEFTVSGPFSETQVPNYNAQSFVISSGSIAATSSNTTTRSETITTNFYNLSNVDQSTHKGKKYKGYLTIDNAQCQNGYIVTLNANGGSSTITTLAVEGGQTYGTLPTPVKEGYTFAGWEKARIPLEYREIKYLQSTGAQSVNSGLPGNNSNLSFDIEYSWNELPASGVYAYVFASYSAEADNTTRILQYGPSVTYVNTNSKAGGGTGVVNLTRTVNTVYHDTLTAVSNNEFTYTTNNSPLVRSYVAGNNVERNIFLFSAPSGGAKSNIKLYYLKIYNNGSLVRDFVPCYRVSDNVGGLYDLVGGNFYTTTLTTPFIKGANIDYITSATVVSDYENHTLTAIWTAN